MTSGKREVVRGVGSPWREKKERADPIRHTDKPLPLLQIQYFNLFIFFGDTDSTHSATMWHPLIIGIMTVNTSLTVIYWTFILSDAYLKWLVEPEDKPKKVVVSPA